MENNDGKMPAEFFKPVPTVDSRKELQDKLDAKTKAEEAEIKRLFSKTQGIKDQENQNY